MIDSPVPETLNHTPKKIHPVPPTLRLKPVFRRAPESITCALRRPESIGYSGSSGGALVAGTLSSGIDAEALSSFVVDRSWPVAGHNPFKLLGQV